MRLFDAIESNEYKILEKTIEENFCIDNPE